MQRIAFLESWHYGMCCAQHSRFDNRPFCRELIDGRQLSHLPMTEPPWESDAAISYLSLLLWGGLHYSQPLGNLAGTAASCQWPLPQVLKMETQPRDEHAGDRDHLRENSSLVTEMLAETQLRKND